MSNEPPILELRNVCKRFHGAEGAVEVLHDIHLKLFSGDFVVLTGPSGSGKTTLLMTAGLLYAADAGRIYLNGNDISNASDAELCRLRKMTVGMVFQKFCLMGHRTVLENVLFRFRYMPDVPMATATQAARGVLERVGLLEKENQAARLLSAGEMQRVAIARAVVCPPRLLLADEPTGNLDQESARWVMTLFDEFQQEGMGILLVTHNPDWLYGKKRHGIMKSGVLTWEKE